jgi:hypothetical protein
MPAGQRDLFGHVTVSSKEYMPLMAVARIDSLIGEEEARGEGDAAVIIEPAVSLHEQKLELRDLHRLLVSTVARNSGIDHRKLNAELIARTGSRVDQATVEQLRKRIQLLERWKERGYDGKR